jgi:hypothetical protein
MFQNFLNKINTNSGEIMLKNAMILDDLMPEFDFSESHSLWMRASPQQSYDALKRLRVGQVRLLAPLMHLRGLPARLNGRQPVMAMQANLLKDMTAGGFEAFADSPGKEYVFGMVGQPWRLEPGPGPEQAHGMGAFKELVAGDWCKIAANFTFLAEAGGCRVSTITRVACTSRHAWRCFLPYWALIRIPSGMLRMSMLKAVRREAFIDSQGRMAGQWS